MITDMKKVVQDLIYFFDKNPDLLNANYTLKIQNEKMLTEMPDNRTSVRKHGLIIPTEYNLNVAATLIYFGIPLKILLKYDYFNNIERL